MTFKPYIVTETSVAGGMAERDISITTGGGSGGGGNMEIRITKLETDVEYIKRDVGEVRTDMRDVRDRMTRLETSVSHLPSKAYVFSVFGIVGAAIAAINLFDSQIQKLLGLAS